MNSRVEDIECLTRYLPHESALTRTLEFNRDSGLGTASGQAILLTGGAGRIGFKRAVRFRQLGVCCFRSVRKTFEAALPTRHDGGVFKILGGLFSGFRCDFHVDTIRTIEKNLAIDSGDFGGLVEKLVLCHSMTAHEPSARFLPLQRVEADMERLAKRSD